jgi:hypothetical protein
MDEFEPQRTNSTSTNGRSRRRATTVALRGALAASVLTAGSVHLYLWVNGYRELPTVGPLFVLNFAASVLIAATVVATPRVAGYALAMAFGASTIAAFLLSVAVGISGYKEVLLGRAQVVAGAAELAALFLGGWLMARSVRAGRRREADGSRGDAASSTSFVIERGDLL